MPSHTARDCGRSPLRKSRLQVRKPAYEGLQRCVGIEEMLRREISPLRTAGLHVSAYEKAKMPASTTEAGLRRTHRRHTKNTSPPVRGQHIYLIKPNRIGDKGGEHWQAGIEAAPDLQPNVTRFLNRYDGLPIAT